MATRATSTEPGPGPGPDRFQPGSQAQPIVDRLVAALFDPTGAEQVFFAPPPPQDSLSLSHSLAHSLTHSHLLPLPTSFQPPSLTLSLSLCYLSVSCFLPFTHSHALPSELPPPPPLPPIPPLSSSQLTAVSPHTLTHTRSLSLSVRSLRIANGYLER